MKSNIALIGMPSVGKSTIGVILAKILGYRFIDTDILIQNNTKLLLSDIIEKFGTEKFIKIENDTIKNIIDINCVIATGGSAVYGFEGMNNLKKISTVIYLKEDFEVLSKRLQDIKGRGVVLKEGQTIYDIYAERSPLYEKYADIIIDEENRNVEETIKIILNQLKE